MIGLKRNTIRVVDYDPDWAMLALEGRRVVRNACGELLVDLQHVGSTAVPELPAKPILDIVAALATIDSMPEIVRRLTRIGYLDRGDQGDAGGHVLVLESSRTSERSICTLWNTAAANGENTFASVIYCGKGPAIRKKYAELKRDLASICRDDREAYTTSKADFIREVLDNSGNWTDASGNYGNDGARERSPKTESPGFVSLGFVWRKMGR
jgi:GrpB-like predicted nucleotidyltransferase (UPF0157 family)